MASETTLLPEQAVDLADARTRTAIALIWREARLLDAKDYQGWDTLFADDAQYVVPIDPAATDFASTLNLVFDDDRMRRMRIERLVGGHSISATAAARTVRTVTGFTLVRQDDAAIELKSSMVLLGYKREETFVLAGEITHRIVFGETGEDGEPRIKQKVIRLINSEDTVTASGFLL